MENLFNKWDFNYAWSGNSNYLEHNQSRNVQSDNLLQQRLSFEIITVIVLLETEECFFFAKK